MTFDLDLWPTDLNMNRDHLLIKDYLPTKFGASGAKRSWVIRCTRFGRLTWPLTLTFDLLTWIWIGIIYSSRTIYLLSLELLVQSVLELSVAQGLGDWHDLWPTDLNMNRDHLLIKDYLPTKFGASGAKRSWVISCTRLRDTNIPTNMCNAICPSFFEGGHKYQWCCKRMTTYLYCVLNLYCRKDCRHITVRKEANHDDRASGK